MIYGWQKINRVWITINNGDVKKAAQVFENSNWKGGSYYKAGDYQKAYEEFKKDSSTKGLYNQGNSLTHLGEYAKAIDAYKQAIKKDQILKMQKII